MTPTPSLEERQRAAVAYKGNKSISIEWRFGRWVAATSCEWLLNPKYKGRTLMSGTMNRTSTLYTAKEVIRWGKRHGIDVTHVAKDLEQRNAQYEHTTEA